MSTNIQKKGKIRYFKIPTILLSVIFAWSCCEIVFYIIAVMVALLVLIMRIADSALVSCGILIAENVVL